MRNTETTPKRLKIDFYRLALDWVHLHTQLPRPIATFKGRTSKYRTYGHPAQWASDKAAEIAAIFYGWHDLMAEHRNETPPKPGTAEQVRIVKAWKYLEPRLDELLEIVEPDDLREVRDIHYEIRRALGHNNPRQVLPIPCPDCNLRTLTRTIAVGTDTINCGACSYQVSETYYPLLVRIALDTLIESRDSTKSP